MVKKEKDFIYMKPVWMSKTLWFNLISLLLLIAEGVLETGWVDPKVMGIIIVAVNGVLRLWFSDSVLSFKK